ncbi:hypothetical protein [Haloplasma contractile]|uniref:Uncharacterized protein n=1 Tax=Haloplasma contractile SSD-17B TaxID=1033810 RepID=F7PU46_9MOLU|nr:hypothetical protein [Haloplasma contractile]ERJ11776.1 hypothetical protein HLPCO_002259 [Haloplasma contractile SSD-17B]
MVRNQEEAFQTLIIKARKEQSKKDRLYGLVLLSPLLVFVAFLYIDESILSELGIILYTIIYSSTLFVNVFTVYVRYQGTLLNFKEKSRQHFAINNIKYIIQKNNRNTIINNILPRKQKQIDQLLKQALSVLEHEEATDIQKNNLTEIKELDKKLVRQLITVMCLFLLSIWLISLLQTAFKSTSYLGANVEAFILGGLTIALFSFFIFWLIRIRTSKRFKHVTRHNNNN